MSGLQPDRRGFLRGLSAATALSGVSSGGWCRAQETAPTSMVRQVATGRRGVVATVHPLASRAAVAAFDRGGNAVDAAIAASVMLSVVDGFNSGLGGGCLALVRTHDGQVHAIDGRERAPAAAAPSMFYRDGKADPRLSQVGPLAAGVPGLLAALEQLATQHSAIDWRDSLLGAAAVADSGFKIDTNYAKRLASVASQLKKFPESARILLNGSGQPRPAGDRLRQTDLARTLRKIADQGSAWFYQGEFAQRTAQFLHREGGLMTAKDFADYRCELRTPIRTQYRDHSVIGFPPPSSGGIHITQMLGMLGRFDVRKIFAESEITGRHLLAEVMKRAMADRAYWLGDADFTKVPRGLIDPNYLQSRAQTIDLSRATSVKSHGEPPAADIDLFGGGGHTTHLTTADDQGNVVALTQTINTTFGCKMIVPGTGVVLNNELDDFSLAPGVPNAFGLVGSEANLIAPGKRPLSSMSPTLVLDAANRPRLTCGAAGGPKIITTVLQVVVRVLDLEATLPAAIAAPRTHHQWSPNQAVCENAVSDQVCDGLQQLGHQIKRIGSAAVAQGINFNEAGMTAASDPRVPSAAMSC